MDGFRDRLSGRYDRADRSNSRDDRYDDRYEDTRYDDSRYEDSRYEDSGYDDRYEDRYERGRSLGRSTDRTSEDRFDRSSRRETISIDAINNAIDSSNRDQLEVIMDMIDEVKADGRANGKAVIESVSGKLEALSQQVAAKKEEPAKEEAAAVPVAAADDQTQETLSRIERMTSQNAETISEGSEMLERSVNSLRSNSELLNDIKLSVDALKEASDNIASSNQAMQQNLQQSLIDTVNSNQQNILAAVSSQQAAPVSYEDNRNEVSEEILNAVGDNRTLLNMIRQDIITRFEKSEGDESANGEEGEAKESYLTAETAGKYYKDLEEHVHKECVKCYRNVQSALSDQNTEALAKTEKSVAGVHTLAVISIALNVVTIALLVCQIMGIF